MTNIPEPVFGDLGFETPTPQQTLTGVQQDISSAFGGGLNPALNTPQGQLATSWAAAVQNKNDEFIKLSNQFDPAVSSGRWQDGIARIYFLSRNPAQATVVQAVCTGAQDVEVPEGSLAQDQAGNIYSCTDGGSFDNTGTMTLAFACTALGPIACPAGSLNIIYRAIPGWDTITNPTDGVIGTDVESQQQFEARRRLTVAANSRNTNEAVLGAVLSLADVLDAYVIDNPLPTDTAIGGVTVLKNSIYVSAVGAPNLTVATAIWTKKPPGCNMNGNTTVIVQGSPDLYSPPLPQYSITFERPTALPIVFAVNLLTSPQTPANAVALVQQAIIAAFAGADGGARAKIGSTIFALRYVSPVIALGSWAQVISLQIGSFNTPASTFNGNIAGTVLTVTSGTPPAIGQTIYDAGGIILPGTVVTGGTGPFTVSVAQAISTRAMYGFLANRTSVVVHIDQAPTISAANIAVTFS